MATELSRISEQMAAAVEAAAPSVVAVHTKNMVTVSGIRWSDEVVVTADHAVHNQDVMAVTLPSGEKIGAALAGRDPGTDLAVIRLSEAPRGAATGAWPEPAVRPGHLVLAVGRSREHGALASMGVVSLAGESWRTWRGGSVDRMIRLDIGLHPAMAGCLVIDAAGNPLGLGTRGLSRLGAVVIPGKTISRVVDAILASGRVARGYLGLGLQPVPVPEHLMKQWSLSHSRALMVVSVEPDGPAERAGILLGDILVSINQQILSDTNDVLSHLDGDAVGRVLPVQLLRGGQRVELSLTIGERPGKE